MEYVERLNGSPRYAALAYWLCPTLPRWSREFDSPMLLVMRFLLIATLLLSGCECLKPAHRVDITIYRTVSTQEHPMWGVTEVLSRETIEVTDSQFHKMFGD